MKTRILITGAAGFFGSHLMEEILCKTDWDIVALCRMTYVGDIGRIVDSLHVQKHAHRIKLIYHDLKFELPPHIVDSIGEVDYVAHIAANSHVDRSIVYPKQFFEDNVMGTINLLEWYRKYSPKAKFINFLTDEVFGPAPEDYDFKEDDRWRPSNPYSASKAGQGAAGICYYTTYNLPIITTYTMNIFGERQHPEKLVAKSIRNIYNNIPIPIHAKLGPNSEIEYVGERHWLHARNAASAILFLFQNGVSGEHYNIVGDTKLHNDDMVNKIASIMQKQAICEYVDFHLTRPGHDRRYALNNTKLKNMGWNPPVDFEKSLQSTIEWTISNEILQ